MHAFYTHDIYKFALPIQRLFQAATAEILGRSAWAQQVASKFSPSIIELQKFCQTWWLLKVQLLLALIVMTWALVLLALQ